jgi:chromosome segregation ATPase
MSEDLVNRAQRYAGSGPKRDEAQAEVKRLTKELDEAQAGVLQLTHQNIEKFDEIKRLKNAIDHLTSERDAARAEVKRLTAERDTAQANVKWLIDRGNGKASLNRLRATDEDIWREAFMQQLHDYNTVEGLNEKMDAADVALAQYRKRWPQ